MDGLINRIGVYDFENPYELLKTDGQRFYETALSGQAQALEPTGYELKQYYLERSNVDLSQEISDMIVTQRAFQFSSKVVQTADEIEDIVNSLRR